MVAEVACGCAVGCFTGASIVASGGALLTFIDRRLAQIIAQVVPLFLQGLRIEVEEVRLRLGRRVSVQIRSLRLLNPDGYKSEYLLRADDARVTVDVFALVISACRSLGKPQDVHISDIMLHGARLHYERALRTSNVAEVLAILESLVPKTEEEEEEELETGGILGDATHVVHAAKDAATSTVDTAHNVVNGAVGSVVDTAPVQAAAGHVLAARGAVTSTAQSVAESAHGVVEHATPNVHAAVADAVGATHTAVSHAAGGILATAQDVHHAKDVSATVGSTGVHKEQPSGGSCFSCFSCFGGLCKRKKYKKKYSPKVHLHGVHISGLSVVPMLSARLMTFVPIGVPPIKITDLDQKVQKTIAKSQSVSAACRFVLDTIFSRSVEAITTAGELPDSKLEDVNKANDSPGKDVQRSWFVNVWAGLLPCCQKPEEFQDTPLRGED